MLQNMLLRGNKELCYWFSASYSDASYSSDEEDGGINPREKEQVSYFWKKFKATLPLFQIRNFL